MRKSHIKVWRLILAGKQIRTMAKALLEISTEDAISRIKREMMINDGKINLKKKKAIVYHQGNIFDYDLQALINPVNCIGVSGRGLAAKFKHEYPDIYRKYAKACKLGYINLGMVYPATAENGKIVIVFPTKYHYNDYSKLEDISAGLDSLVRVIKRKGIRSIGIPAVGCGLGYLNYDDVKFLIKQKLTPLVKQGIKVVAFEPL